MKKVLTYLILFIGFVLLPFTSVSALTKVSFNEISNGEVKTTLNFEEGFIGGIDVTLKVSGNVNLEDIKLADGLEKYTTSIKKNKNTVNIIITSGGVDSTHNLLNIKRELVLGNIIVNSKESTSYKIELTNLKIIDNSWNTKEIEKDNYEIIDNSFNYVNKSEIEDDDEEQTPSNPEESGDQNNPSDSEKEENKPSDDKSDDDKPDENKPDDGKSDDDKSDETEPDNEVDTNEKEDNKPSNNESNKTDSNSSNNSSDKNTQDKDQNDSSNTNASDKNDKTDNELDNNDSNTENNQNSSDKEEVKEKKSNLDLYLITGISVVAVGISIVIIKLRKSI